MKKCKIGPPAPGLGMIMAEVLYSNLEKGTPAHFLMDIPNLRKFFLVYFLEFLHDHVLFFEYVYLFTSCTVNITYYIWFSKADKCFLPGLVTEKLGFRLS